MPRRAFIADLQAVTKACDVPGVSEVRAGTDDGEFSFVVAAPCGRLEISASVPDLADYPVSHIYFVFGDDNVPEQMSMKLPDSSVTKGKPIAELLNYVADALVHGFNGDVDMHDAQDSPALSGDDSDEDTDFSEEDLFGIDPHTSSHKKSIVDSGFTHITSSVAFVERLQSDLQIVKKAGFRVGHHGMLAEGRSAHLSISIRIKKLGISEEALEAWQVSAADYLVLIIYYPHGYRTTEGITAMEFSRARSNIEFRVGICDSYKPSLQDSLDAFSKSKVGGRKRGEGSTRKEDGEEHHGQRGFRDAFISKALVQLLNERLPALLRYRFRGMTWEGAEKFLKNFQGKSAKDSECMQAEYANPEPANSAFEPIVTSDHMLDARYTHKTRSLPLLAMQFLLRHFVRCTEFCLVCHSKLDNDLQALKPYVCDGPLCLYQYMSLGFGPSMEHEIMTQTHVVDLLVSFAYNSAQLGKLASFPTGLNLQVPPPHISQVSIDHLGYAYDIPKATAKAASADSELYDAQINRETSEILFPKGICPVKTEDWICVLVAGEVNKGRWEHGQIIDTDRYPIVKLVTHAVLDHPNLAQPAAPAAPANLFVPCKVYKYAVNFDNLSIADKRVAIVAQLDLLPPVAAQREYLVSNRSADLSSWNRIPPAAYGILRWIIASNRACIVQVDNPDRPGAARDQRVLGMDGWMQFKFAMGAPDKERRFKTSVDQTRQRLRLQHPTLFAWHGSPIQNWHSIIREGLHFEQTLHGRSFGHGCYHSLDFHVSSGYCLHRGQAAASNAYVSQYSWPSSALRITSALALNEIVNAPQEFVSRTPHLVVSQLDWIQTRYLFVSCDSGLRFADSASNASAAYPQDPAMTPIGCARTRIVIPVKAMPKSRRPIIGPNQTRKKLKVGSARNPVVIDDDDFESDTTDDEDRLVLTKKPTQLQAHATSTPNHISRGEPGVSSQASTKLLSLKQISAAKLVTSFSPGTLDFAELPIMAEPKFATHLATKRLQKDFKALVDVQMSTPLHELGWYVDEGKLENMYQWIVELHSFDKSLPLAKQIQQRGIQSVVLEIRFGPEYPMSPPFIRVIRPRFLSFNAGGGGHVTLGGSICMELLTNSGWSAVSSMESVLLQVHLAISSTEPRPAQLDAHTQVQYSTGEAVDAYIRACQIHGWKIPDDLRLTATGTA